KYFEKVFDVAISEEKTNKPDVHLLKEKDGLKSGEKALRCIVALLGETEPEAIALSPTYSIEIDPKVYRYDWMFGITVPLERKPYWNWRDPLREASAFVVQLLISTSSSGFGFTELSTALVALSPSKDTRSWLESHSEQLGKSLLAGASVAEQVGGIVPKGNLAGSALAAVLRTSSIISNFVSSGEGQNKNWYIYRFLDAEENCCAVEWQINKRVLLEYGPLLRGSLLMAFHGSRASEAKDGAIKLILRPNLGYYENDALCNIRPTLKLEDSERPQLTIKPRTV